MIVKKYGGIETYYIAITLRKTGTWNLAYVRTGSIGLWFGNSNSGRFLRELS